MWCMIHTKHSIAVSFILSSSSLSLISVFEGGHSVQMVEGILFFLGEWYLSISPKQS